MGTFGIQRLSGGMDVAEVTEARGGLGQCLLSLDGIAQAKVRPQARGILT